MLPTIREKLKEYEGSIDMKKVIGGYLVQESDEFGLFNLVIGAGAVQSGSMTTIDWAGDNYYLKVGMDASGGTNFLVMGTTQLLSVPYALHAATADSLIGGTSSFSGNYNDLTNQPTTVDSISSTGDTLYLSNGQTFVAGGSTSGTGNLVLPTITTNAVTGITSNSATFGGAITIQDGYVTLRRTMVASNKASFGAGIHISTVAPKATTYPHLSVKDDDNNGDLLKMSTTSSIVATGGGGPTATGGRIGRRSGSTDSGRGRIEAEHGIEHR